MVGRGHRRTAGADLTDDGVFGAKGAKTFARSADWRAEADRILGFIKAKKQAS